MEECFCQPLNTHGVNDIRQTEMRSLEPLLPEPSSFESEISIEKLKRRKSLCTDQIPTEMIQAGNNILS
jgi:hypothetical protein